MLLSRLADKRESDLAATATMVGIALYQVLDLVSPAVLVLLTLGDWVVLANGWLSWYSLPQVPLW